MKMERGWRKIWIRRHIGTQKQQNRETQKRKTILGCVMKMEREWRKI